MEIFKKKKQTNKTKTKEKKITKQKKIIPKNQFEVKLKNRFFCYKAKVFKYYNECSKTNATRNKRIPKFRSLKYKHT